MPKKKADLPPVKVTVSDADAKGTFTLTLAAKEAQAVADAAGGGSGQGELMQALSKLPMARSEVEGNTRGYDHVHLSRAYDTDLVRWWGRRADGYHYPIGRLMQIVKVAR